MSPKRNRHPNRRVLVKPSLALSYIAEHQYHQKLPSTLFLLVTGDWTPNSTSAAPGCNNPAYENGRHLKQDGSDFLAFPGCAVRLP